MLTMNNRVKDAYKQEDTRLQIERYTSVKEINRVFRLIMPFKFSTLRKLVPGPFKVNIDELLYFLNGGDNIVSLGDEGTLPLWEKDKMPFNLHNKAPFIMPFLLKDKKAPAVLVVPGGAYLNVAMKFEGIKTAKKLNEMGFHAVILSYRVSPSRYPSMQLDMMKAIKLMRKNADRWGIEADKILALGFSAGGHLVLSEPGVYEEINLKDELHDIDGRPNGIISGYGMMSLKCGSMGITADKIFLGGGMTEKRSEELSVQNLVNKDYPPVFMFSMEHDPLVHPENNCMELDKILDRLNVPHELHIYKGDRHGFDLGEGTDAESWPEEMIEFFRKQEIL